jgi:Ribbon-helix-helix protein, copG family
MRVGLDRRELEALDRLRVMRGGLTRSQVVRDLIAQAGPAPTAAKSRGATRCRDWPASGR